MTTTTKHRCFIPEIEYYCRNCACVKKLRVGTCHGTSRTFGPGKDRGLSVRPLFYLSGPSDRRHLGKTVEEEETSHVLLQMYLVLLSKI